MPRAPSKGSSGSQNHPDLADSTLSQRIQIPSPRGSKFLLLPPMQSQPRAPRVTPEKSVCPQALFSAQKPEWNLPEIRISPARLHWGGHSSQISTGTEIPPKSPPRWEVSPRSPLVSPKSTPGWEVSLKSPLVWPKSPPGMKVPPKSPLGGNFLPNLHLFPPNLH